MRFQLQHILQQHFYLRSPRSLELFYSDEQFIFKKLGE